MNSKQIFAQNEYKIKVYKEFHAFERKSQIRQDFFVNGCLMAVRASVSEHFQISRENRSV